LPRSVAAAQHGFEDDAEIYVASGLRDVAHGLPQAYAPTTADELAGSSFLQEQVGVRASDMGGLHTGRGLLRHHLHLRRAASGAQRFTPGSFSQYGIAGPEGGPSEVRRMPAAPEPLTARPRSVSWVNNLSVV